MTTYTAHGDSKRAIDSLKQCENDIETWSAPIDKLNMMSRIMRIYLRLGQPSQPYHWLKNLEYNLGGFQYRLSVGYLGIVDILRNQNTAESRQQALELIETLHQICTTYEMDGIRIDVYCLQALTTLDDGDSLDALIPLRQALQLAEPQGYIRTFVDYGEPMAYLLYEAVARDIHKQYAGFLLSKFTVAENKAIIDEHGNLIEPLSERELEVLNLLGEGMSNQEIANELYLTLNTIKVHNRNIFGKLNVKNRTQAVAKGRQLGIITS